MSRLPQPLFSPLSPSPLSSAGDPHAPSQPPVCVAVYRRCQKITHPSSNVTKEYVLRGEEHVSKRQARPPAVPCQRGQSPSRGPLSLTAADGQSGAALDIFAARVFARTHDRSRRSSRGARWTGFMSARSDASPSRTWTVRRDLSLTHTHRLSLSLCVSRPAAPFARLQWMRLSSGKAVPALAC